MHRCCARVDVSAIRGGCRLVQDVRKDALNRKLVANALTTLIAIPESQTGIINKLELDKPLFAFRGV